MSDPVSALQGAVAQGFARVEEIGPLGMITLRAKPGTEGLEAAIKAATGCDLPGARRITHQGANSCGWMSNDEFLLVLPYADVAKALAAIAVAMAGAHHLAVDVSDARAVFRVTGPQADQVLRKLTPADLDKVEADEIRRSRFAQVAAAFWPVAAAGTDCGYTLVCFRSVAGYVMGLLTHAAQAGSEL
ncbi:sarcosine oxidase subunit gamma family protein [Gemmobacter sp. 24YEA27]|uniref:sarcosine oxidase subunit gamma n=1 Tax=Gemmobacter sp. 24YEA27 TaxID=3040672 RepID=UPI0024B3BF35|nr:sarcosine oxidase subunit gamma family protein [Gemmobacter sp. 24YEA27]